MEVDYNEEKDLFVYLQAIWFFGLVQVNFYPLELMLSFSIFNNVLFKQTVPVGRRREKKRREKKKKAKKRFINLEFIKQAIIKVFNDVHPRFYIFLRTGFETPLLTGLLFPVSGALRQFSGSRIELCPDFSSDTIILKSYFSARILILQLLITGVQLFFVKKEIKKHG